MIQTQINLKRKQWPLKPFHPLSVKVQEVHEIICFRSFYLTRTKTLPTPIAEA